jgi:hypothetical protein
LIKGRNYDFQTGRGLSIADLTFSRGWALIANLEILSGGRHGGYRADDARRHPRLMAKRAMKTGYETVAHPAGVQSEISAIRPIYAMIS